MPHVSGRDLKADVLFRASENTSGASGWDTQALDYLNRSYRALATGASEFLPEHVEDWWWMRAQASLILEPMFNTGSVTAVQGSDAITFSAAYPNSMVGWHIRMDGNPDIFTIIAHIAGGSLAQLDTVFTGPSTTSNYKLMKLRYPLDAAVSVLLSPMTISRDNYRIMGLTPERMDVLFPLHRFEGGVPTAFAMESGNMVRFNVGGRDDGTYMRVDYRYKPVVADITDSDLSIPLVPLEYRHLLSDMAVTYLMIDKNDDRAQTHAAAARSGLTAMFRENRRRIKQMDETAGRIFSRAGQRGGREPLRTESGLIIG